MKKRTKYPDGYGDPINKILLALVVLVIAAVIYGVTAWRCSVAWGDSTMPWRLKVLQCQVKHPTMGWINEERVRGTD